MLPFTIKIPMAAEMYGKLLIAGLLGVGLGAINAVLISFFNLPALIVTLATSNIFFGLLLENVPTAHISKVPEWVGKFGSGRIFELTNAAGNTYGLSYLAFTSLVLLAIFAIALRYTGLGRNIYAIGSSREAARRAGISIWRTQFFIYCFVGFLSGIASILNTSLISYVNPFNIQAVTMDVIAAVVLGGAALSGGKGSIIGSFLGVAILFLIKNSLVQLGVPSTWDSIIVGSVLIISIAITMIRSESN
jgi:simple sugar transport system permease protein